MNAYQPLVYKIATDAREMDMIHALNYRTFVDEIPQHAANGARRLVDRFHAENTYVTCFAGERLAGMVALRGNRPFSLDEKVPELESRLPPGRRPCEIRLLAVEREYRKTSVFAGLMVRLLQIARARGYDLALISGTTRQLKLYRHLGFEPFAGPVGSSGAQYQPMMLTWERFESRLGSLFSELSAAPARASFLPGPVQTTADVRQKFAEPTISHREPAFLDSMAGVREKLRTLTRAAHATVLLGSGTLANDVVGAQLSRQPGRGLVLSNGEFGERLIDHASRWRLGFDVYRCKWGAPFDLAQVANLLGQRPRWLWFVHCETSTGVLNDLSSIEALCNDAGTAVCVDAISSIGSVDVDLRAVAFATAVSGKGLGAYPGLAIVLHRDRPSHDGVPLPRYLDLAMYATDGVPFTHSSNLLGALASALERAGPEHNEGVRRDAALLRRKLDDAGLSSVASPAHASPSVTTLALPAHVSARDVAARVAKAGYAVACNSGYLIERNWLQIALMGEHSRSQLVRLVSTLRDAVHTSSGTLARRG